LQTPKDQKLLGIRKPEENNYVNDQHHINLCNFDQVSKLISEMTSQFTNTIKLLCTKFEELNTNRLDKLESTIFDMNKRMDKLQTDLNIQIKMNNNLKDKLCNDYIDKVKQEEKEFEGKFILYGIDSNDTSVIEGHDAREIWNNFTKNNLQLKNEIKLDQFEMVTYWDKKANKQSRSLMGKLNKLEDYKHIFGNVSKLKDTNLKFDKLHCKTVGQMLNDFKKSLYNHKQQKGKDSGCIKDYKLFLDDEEFDVFNILKNRYMKQI
jgi:hypothetical protein